VPEEKLKEHKKATNIDGLRGFFGSMLAMVVQLVIHRSPVYLSVAYLGACCYEQTTYIKVCAYYDSGIKGSAS